MTDVIPFREKMPVQQKCAFCGNGKDHVKNLVMGQSGKCICDACIKHARKRLRAEVDEVLKHD